MDLSVVVVNFNCAAHTVACVRSLREHCGSLVEIVVVDNASSAADRRQLEEELRDGDCVLVLSEVNGGFAAGCNIGAKRAKSNWLHFLNPDCTVDRGARQVYESLSRLPDDAIYTTRMRDGSGALRGNVYAVPRMRNLFRAWLGKPAAMWAQGSSILLTRSRLHELGGWDEGYFMYAEDLDLCYTAHKRGMALRTLDMDVVHIGGASSSTAWCNMERELRVFKAQKRFFRKHASLAEYGCVVPLLVLRAAVLDRQSPVPVLRAFIRSLISR